VPRLLIAVDETDESHHAVRVAHSLFGDNCEYLAINVAEDPHKQSWGGAPLAWGSVITYPFPYATEPYAVVPSPVLPAGDDPRGIHDRTQDAMHRAEDVAAEVTSQSGLAHVEAVGEIGDPAEAIAAAAESHRVDLIVVGSHEKGWFRRMLDGSVAEDLLRSTHIPVLVVNPEGSAPTNHGT
jgi:nucleotide-binding universal stress UspA family protein